MPGLESLIPFALFWIVAVLTPGPNTLLFTWVALGHPRTVALACVAGIQACGLLWALAGLFGLVWIMQHHPEFFRIAQIVGGLYIVWRGLVLIGRLFNRNEAQVSEASDIPAIDKGAAFRMGFLTNLSNPKTFAFVASLFATTSVAQGPLWLGLTGIALMMAISFSYYLTLLVLFARPQIVAAYQGSRQWIEAAAGAIFVFFGSELLWGGISAV